MKLLCCLVAWLCLLAAVPAGAIPPCAAARQEGGNNAFRSPFRYLIFDNELRFGRRDVSVLLDESAFSEESLKVLFSLIKKRFPEPDHLMVDVYTSLEQVATPEEKESGLLIHAQGRQRENKYHFAFFIRNGPNAFFRFTTDPLNLNLKTTVLRGTSPYQ